VINSQEHWFSFVSDSEKFPGPNIGTFVEFKIHFSSIGIYGYLVQQKIVWPFLKIQKVKIFFE